MTFPRKSCKDLSTYRTSNNTRYFTVKYGRLNLNRHKPSKCTSRKNSLLLCSQEEANPLNAHEHRLNTDTHDMPQDVGSWIIRRGLRPNGGTWHSVLWRTVKNELVSIKVRRERFEPLIRKRTLKPKVFSFVFEK